MRHTWVFYCAFLSSRADPDDCWMKISQPIFLRGILEIEYKCTYEGQRSKRSSPMGTNNTKQSDAGLLFFFSHNSPLKATVRRNSLFLWNHVENYDSIWSHNRANYTLDGKCCHILVFRHQTLHLRNRHNPLTSASQIYPYSNSTDAIMSHTVKQTTNINFTEHIGSACSRCWFY